MKAIEKIIDEFGGIEGFSDAKVIQVRTEPFRSLLIESVGGSPNGLPSISVSQESRESGENRIEIQMIFELCDLGWFPYYYKNVFDIFEGVVYKRDSEGRILAVRHTMRQKLIQIARDWDALLENLEYTTLSGIYDVATFFPRPFFLSGRPVQ